MYSKQVATAIQFSEAKTNRYLVFCLWVFFLPLFAVSMEEGVRLVGCIQTRPASSKKKKK